MTVIAPEGTEEILAELRRYLDEDPPAISLPPRAYTSPEMWELEKERIFSRAWMHVAHVDQLAEAGDYVSLSIAGEAVVVTRGKDGALHAMSPVCRHRLMPLVGPGAGRAQSFTCPYHLWNYGLDGRLRGAPHMGGNPDFDPKNCRLPGFAVEEWNGLVYVNLDAAAEPIGPHLDLATPEFGNYRIGDLVQVVSFTEEWQANWKLALENGHENYHVIGLHRQTLEPFMPGGGDIYVKQYSPWALHARVPFVEPIEPEALKLGEVEKAHAMFLLSFPTGGLAGLGDQIVWLSFIPQSIDTLQVRGGMLMPPELVASVDPEALARAQQAFTTMVNDEDKTGLEAVQRGVTSRFAERGHLSPKEAGVIAFYKNLARALTRQGNAWPGEL
ncbi:SRPBCC family protein [Nonomuraea sp. NPDC050547]|uniref:aromatic ring-hydroxylating oxygenase subunit alpha n=1 Tax=unclassified Nonomuraea TaxID=2593643 RepID=UPI0037AB12A9